MADAGATGPVIDVTPSTDVVPIPSESHVNEDVYAGQTQWWVYALLALGIYLLWEE
jgi:hypothetical protein